VISIGRAQPCCRYQESFVNKFDAFINVSIIVLTLPMALPSDIMFYNNPQRQALLFSITGFIGLAVWCTSSCKLCRPL
jgi:hypothetical protein